MRPSATQVRVGLTFFYFIFSFGTLFYFSDSQFCLGSDRQGYVMTTALLALACTAWNIFASACGTLVIGVIEKPLYNSVTAPLVSAFIVGWGFSWFPLWIYQGYGGFMFTRAEMSCFFTKDDGAAFVAPVLAMATLVCEWLNLNIKKQ
jgi:hypothetical protein